MKRIMLFIMFSCFTNLAIAGTTNPESDYVWKAGYDVTLTQGDLTLQNGDLSVTGNVTVTGDLSLTGNITSDGLETKSVSSTVYLSTSSSLSITDSVMVICGTGTITSNATPFISTTTYTEGTHFMIVGGSNTVTLQDNGTKSGTLLELGGNTRSVGQNDVLELLLINGKWIEVGFGDN